MADWDVERCKLQVKKLKQLIYSGAIDDDWVSNFVDSIDTLLASGVVLSSKQISKLEEVYEKH